MAGTAQNAEPGGSSRMEPNQPNQSHFPRMDVNTTINAQQLSELLREQTAKAKSEETKVALADLVTTIGTNIARNRSPGFNVAGWIEACGVTPDFKRSNVAA
jgi:hypothetical protein